MYSLANGQAAERPIPKRRNHLIPTMKTTRHFQKISAGLSLFILALGFSLIGLRSLIHPTLSRDTLAFSATSCFIGGWASMAVAIVFLYATFLYWRRGFSLAL